VQATGHFWPLLIAQSFGGERHECGAEVNDFVAGYDKDDFGWLLFDLHGSSEVGGVATEP
jgi:hypothetical protein